MEFAQHTQRRGLNHKKHTQSNDNFLITTNKNGSAIAAS